MRFFVHRFALSCSSRDARDHGPHPSRLPGLARRTARVGAWLVPGTLLALLPKCPVCLAAYVALFTGASLSLESATQLRLLLAALGVSALSLLAFRVVQRWVARRQIRSQR